MYDGVVAISPEELVARSETVILGRFIESDTIASLGKNEYLRDTCSFAVVEYRFQPIRIIKCEQPSENFYLWNYDQCCDEPCNDPFNFVVGDVYLVYGTVIDSAAELSTVARPAMFRYRDDHTFSNWDRADSAFAADLPHSPILISLLGERNTSSTVLAGTDQDLNALYLYSNGNMAFEDTSGGFQLATRQDYLERVQVASGWERSHLSNNTLKISPYAAYPEILKRVLDADEFRPYFLADYDSTTQSITIVDDEARGELPAPKLLKFGRPVRFMDKATADRMAVGRYYFLADFIVVNNTARMQLLDPSRDLLLNSSLVCRNMRWEVEGTNIQDE